MDSRRSDKMPRRPTKEYWKKVYPKVRRKVEEEYGSDGERAGRITGSLWYHKLSKAKKKKYEALRRKREKRRKR